MYNDMLILIKSLINHNREIRHEYYYDIIYYVSSFDTDISQQTNGNDGKHEIWTLHMICIYNTLIKLNLCNIFYLLSQIDVN